MEYRSIHDFGVAIRSNLWQLPQPIDLVVGVPRSGLLAASLISLAMNVPMADVEGYCAGRLLATGKTKRTKRMETGGGKLKRRRVVVIDDSIFMGSSMREARARISAMQPQDDVTYIAVYGNSRRHPDADVVLEAVPQPRLFEWNVMHHAMLAETCMEIDGVLCPPDMHGATSLRDLAPLFVPTKPVRSLVTQRSETDRATTEEWLRRWGVEYGELVMLPDAGDATRAETEPKKSAASFKGEVYRRAPALLFIEGDHAQAQEIARLSGKPVLCTHCFAMLRGRPSDPLVIGQNVRTFTRRFALAKTPLTNPSAAKLMLRQVMGEGSYQRMKHVFGRILRR